MSGFASAVLAIGLALPASSAGLLPGMGGPLAQTRKLFDAGRYREVIAQLSPEQMQKLDGEALAKAYVYLGEAYERTGRLDDALGVYQVGAKLFPKDINLLTQLALLLHRAGLEERARPLFDKILQIHPHNAAAHLGLAELYARLGFLQRSGEHYKQALQSFNNIPGLWRDYGEVLLAQRDYKTAAAAIKKSLDLAADADALVDLAFVQRARGDLGDSLVTLDTAASLKPARRDIRLLRATWLLEAGRFDDAWVIAEDALKNDPSEPLASWIAARVELKRGQAADAQRELRALTVLGKQAPFAARASAALLKALTSEPAP